MRSKARSASAGEWIKESGDGWEAICSAEDQANGNFIIAHFEGPDARANREFSQAANPGTVLALLDELDELEAAQSYAKERDEENQDLMLTVGRLRVEKEAAEKRIAELEARTVMLPQYRNSPDMHTKQFYEAIGFNQGLDIFIEALRAAGIGVKGE
ncbi:ead/Ea22-like family protein [Citrobacter freundii]|uniref:ead/Ea22-like family protein n=2 Tax=Citrobacter freundii TaxID=546 RepID=UPI003C6C5060